MVLYKTLIQVPGLSCSQELCSGQAEDCRRQTIAAHLRVLGGSVWHHHWVLKCVPRSLQGHSQWRQGQVQEARLTGSGVLQPSCMPRTHPAEMRTVRATLPQWTLQLGISESTAFNWSSQCHSPAWGGAGSIVLERAATLNTASSELVSLNSDPVLCVAGSQEHQGSITRTAICTVHMLKSGVEISLGTKASFERNPMPCCIFFSQVGVASLGRGNGTGQVALLVDAQLFDGTARL